MIDNCSSTFDTTWQTKYADQISAEKAVANIRPGQRVFIGTGCAQPQELVRALAARSHELPTPRLCIS